MNTQEARKAVYSQSLSLLDVRDIAFTLCQALDESEAERRHLAEYEKMYQTALDDLCRAQVRGDHFALEAERLKEELARLKTAFGEMEAKCRYFLKADAWVRGRIEHLLKLGGIIPG